MTPHSKQFHIVREAVKEARGEYGPDGKRCPACNSQTVTTEFDKTRRYCLLDRCNSFILEKE